MSKKPIICLDTETSAMFQVGGRAIDLALICIDPDTLIPVQNNAEFQVYINPGPLAKWDQCAIDVHGITKEFVEQNGKSEAEAVELLLNWLHSHNLKTWRSDPEWWAKATRQQRGQVTLLAQNGAFDKEFISILIGLEGLEIFHYLEYDTMQMAILINQAHQWFLGYDGQPFKHPTEHWASVALTAQAHKYGISADGAHGALADARITWKVFRNHILNLAGDLKRSREQLDLLEKQRAASSKKLPEI